MKMTYIGAYNEAFSITKRIYDVYTKITEYKIYGVLDDPTCKEKLENLTEILEEFLDKEEVLYNKIASQFDLYEINVLLNYVEEVGGIYPSAIDFENLPSGGILLIPRRIMNRVDDLTRHNTENARITVLGDNGQLVYATGTDREIWEESGLDIKRVRKEYLETIRLEDIFVEDHMRSMSALMERWLLENKPKDEFEEKVYQGILTSQMMLLFTNYVDERKIIKKNFDFPEAAVPKAPYVADTLRYIRGSYDMIKRLTTISELQDLLEDVITIEEADISDSLSPVSELYKMYFEAGLRNLEEDDFNRILLVFKDVLDEIVSDNENDQYKYYSEDGIKIIKDILNKVSNDVFGYDIIPELDEYELQKMYEEELEEKNKIKDNKATDTKTGKKQSSEEVQKVKKKNI